MARPHLCRTAGWLKAVCAAALVVPRDAFLTHAKDEEKEAMSDQSIILDKTFIPSRLLSVFLCKGSRPLLAMQCVKAARLQSVHAQLFTKAPPGDKKPCSQSIFFRSTLPAMVAFERKDCAMSAGRLPTGGYSQSAHRWIIIEKSISFLPVTSLDLRGTL